MRNTEEGEHMTDEGPEMDKDSIISAMMKGDVLGIRDARLNQIIHDIAEWARRRWTAEDSPNLVTYEIIELAYSYPKRAHDLIESMRALVQADRVVPAVILARALVETIAMGRYFIDKMEKSLADGDFARLETQFFRFYAGSRLGEAKIKSIHINDALRELEATDVDYVSYLVNKYPFLWSMSGPNPTEAFTGEASLLKTYDKLSEISHPNGLGTQYLYPAADAPDNSEVISFYRYMTGVAIWRAHHLLAALGGMKTFPGRFVAKFPDRTRFSDDNPLRSSSG
ncbi:hypothetical protein JJE66_07480 [Bradyrhizobium diazoefficiens]|uniref:hypothetical protein n=1 Tax=Bradyrhizobium diazoefficiens TaxID=1355477 RepID=UPI00190CE378|nr:hypothetical protein [Bradyrhizobium diazoefficiens]MBK3661090.1 hypothetical protein [Bradyrhizobium diazoefficiens]